MNVHDSEKIAGTLRERSMKACANIEEADVIVFNTCCIRDTAEQKIMGNIGAIKKLKKKKPHIIIAVVGCMTQQKGMMDTLKKQFPYIDIILGSNIHELGDSLDNVIENKFFSGSIEKEDRPAIRENAKLFRTSGTNAWLNIMYGCNNFCTYCIVPYVRGRERSRSAKDIIKDAENLLNQGYKEITLLGQNVDSYGNDLVDGWNFAKLISEIARLSDKFRLRFMTSHPKDFNSEVVQAIADNNNICNNVHLPVQSGSDRILKLMNRKYTRKHYLELIDEIKTLPNVGITTDIMVGFPTETEEDFLDTMALMEEVGFSSAFTFVFSPRRGTPAADMEQIPGEIKKDRITRLVALQNKITKEISATYIGNTYEVLCEDTNTKYEGIYCGRTESGRLVSFPGEESDIGKFLQVKVNKAKSASLWGEKL